MTHDQRAKMRARILEAARERFLEEGLDGLSMRSIAQRVGVSSMTLYLYYESRQDIVRHITILGFKALNEALDKAVTAAKAIDRVKQTAQAYLGWADENRRYYSAMFMYLSDDFADAPHDEHLAGPSTYAAELFKKALLQGGLDEAAASLQATSLWCTLHGMATLNIGGQVEQLGTNLEALVSQFLTAAKPLLGAEKAADAASAPKAVAAKGKKK